MGMSRLGARGRSGWVASIFAAVEIACNFWGNGCSTDEINTIGLSSGSLYEVMIQHSQPRWIPCEGKVNRPRSCSNAEFGPLVMGMIARADSFTIENSDP